MSKKKISKRLEHLFEDVKKEEAKPVKPTKLKLTGSLTLSKPIAPARSRVSAQSPKPQQEERPPVTTGVSDGAGAMSLAFQTDERNWATLRVVDETSPRAWEIEEQMLVKQVADQLSLALENARLFQETQKRAEELTVLNELGRELASQLDIHGIAESVYRHTSRLMDTNNFFLATYDDIEQTLTYPLVINEGQRIQVPGRSLAGGLSDYVIRSKKPLYIPENVIGKMKELGIEFLSIGDDSPSLCWLGSPLLSGQKVVGLIAVQSTTRAQLYTPQHRDLLTAIGSQVAIAIENARLFQQTEERNRQLSALNEIISSASQSLDLEDALGTMLERYLATIGFSTALIGLYNPISGKLELIASRDLPEAMSKRLNQNGMGGTICELVYERSSIIAFGKINDEAPIEAKAIQNYGFNAYIGVPLEVRGKVLGTLCAFRYAEGDIIENALALAQSVGRQVGFAIENGRLFTETQRRAREMSALTEVGQDISASLDIQTVLERIANHAKDLLHSFSSAVYVPDPEGRVFQAIVAIGDEAEEIKSDPVIFGEGILGTIAQRKTGEIVNNAISDARAINIQGTQQLSHEHLMAVPLISGERVNGIMAVWRTGVGLEFNPGELEFLTGLSRQATIAVENAHLFEATQQSRLAVARSEGELRALFASMTDIIIVLDKEGTYTRIAPTNPSLLFRPAEEMLGAKVLDLLPSPTAQNIMSALSEALKTDAPVKLEYSLPISGKIYWFDASLSKLSEDQVFLIARDITERKNNELIQAAITQISEAALTAPDTPGLLKVIHAAAETLMPARNFYVSLYDENTDIMTFPYFVDERTTTLPPQRPGKGLTSYVLRTGKPLLATPDTFDELERAGEVTGGASRGVDWLGVPLRSGLKRLGVMAIQTYNSEFRLTEKDRDTLNLLAGQAALAIERRRSQEELVKFKLGIDHSDDAVFITDPDGTITYANPGFEKVYGFKLEETIGRNPRIFKSGLTSREQYQEFWGTLLSKNTVTGEIINKTKDGRLVPVAGTNSPILDEANNIIGFLAVHHDMTATKRAEEALKRRNEYLAAAAEIGRLVTSTLDLNTIFSRTVNLVSERFGYYHAAIFVVEETGFNAVLREATGPAGEEMKRTEHSLPVNEKSIVGKVALNGEPVVVNNTALDSTHKPNPLLPDTRAEAAIPLRVGSRIIGAIDIQSTTVDAFTQDDLAVLQILADQVAIAIDNARSYELSQQAIKEMREVDRLKSQFLANMSHELRTPLNSIIGFSRVILKGIDGPVTDLQQQDLSAIYNSGQHLLMLINDILDLSKIEAGKMELAFDEVNITDVITSVMSTATGLVKDKPIKLLRNIEPDLPTVRADAIRVRQVLINLLSNAAKFTDEGEITVEASVRPSLAGHPEILVSVSDTGPGISREDQAKLFQPFSQVDDSPTRKTGGSGLGLSISQQLIQLHGGRIGVHSTVGKGSTFYFTLPIYRGKEEASEAKGNGGKIVLAIDDDPQVISLYERYLQPQGYQVVSVTDSTHAKERAKQLKPFAITLDIMMPGLDGWAVLNDLKADADTRDIPVIICSIIEEQERGFSLGAADYLLKPILEDDLLNALDRLNGDGSISEVLIIDDDVNDLRLMEKILGQQGHYKTITAEGGKKGWEAITSRMPNAVVLDLFMPDLDGFSILEKMRENARLRDVPVVVVSGGDLTPDQNKQLTEFGQRLLSKGSLNEKDLISTIEHALKRVEKK